MSRDALARSISQTDADNNDKRAQWSTQSYLMEEIASQFTFPKVVKCNAMTILTRRDQPLPLNMAQPFLLYDRRTIRKLLARNVLSDQKTGRFTETDETVVIPADYEGNFLRLRSRTVKDSTVYRSIAALAVNKAPAFINLTGMTAFKMGHSDSNKYPPLEFAPGNVFIVDAPIRGSTRVKSSSRSSNSFIIKKSTGSTTSRQELHYLKCRDERDMPILVPMGQPGEFVEVLRNPYGNGKLSMRPEDIISTQKFPLLARYVYGGGKPRLTSFSGLLTLLDSFEETSIVGCVLDGATFTMLEIPQSSPLLFQIALNDQDIFSLPILKHATRVCESNAAKFARDMKFKFKFAQKILHGGHSPNGVRDYDDPPSATNSARMGVTQTYIYI